MAIIAFGRVDKKLLLVVLMFVIQLVYLITVSYGSDHYENNISTLISDIAPIIGGIALYFIFRNKKVQPNTSGKSKKKFIHVIILFFLGVIHASVDYCYPYFIEEQKYRLNNLLNTINGVTIIIMTLVTLFLLKYKYYIHHYITMALYCVLGIIMDVIVGGYKIINFSYAYIFIIYLFDDVILFCYMKYMMDKLYYQYSEVLIYYGLIGLITDVGFMTGLGIYEYKNDIIGDKAQYRYILDSIQTYFQTKNVAVIIFFQLVYFLILFFIKELLNILIIYYLRPNHTIINDEINVFEAQIIYRKIENPELNIKDSDKYYTFIPFILQMLCLLFYFEILELNFCKLNKNTVKNIQMRERNEGSDEDESKEGRDSFNNNKIELVGQYYLDGDKEETNEDDDKGETKENND